MSYLEGAALYQFNARQLKMLEELISPEYYELFAALLGVDMFGGLSTSDFADICLVFRLEQREHRLWKRP